MTCKEHAQWWTSEVTENNRRFASNTNFTVPLNKDGLLLFVRGGVSGSVGFVEDDSLSVNEAFVDLYVEYDPRTFGKTRFFTLQNRYDGATGVGIFVSASLQTVRFSLVGVGTCVLIYLFWIRRWI